MKSNHRFFAFAAAVMMLSGISMPVSAEERTFTVGFDAEFPPYGYQDESGEYVGFDLDLAQEVCKRNGWELVKQPIDWDSKDMELSTGAIDCIWNGFTIDGREDAYTWSVPYIDNSQVIVVKEGSGISEALDLAGRTVCVQADSSALAALTGEDATDENKALCASFAELSQVGDYNSAFLNLDSGAVDAVILDYGVANYEVESRDGFTILEEPISSEKYGVGFLKGNTALRDTVQNTLFDMADDGTFGTIAEKWGLSDSVCISQYYRAQSFVDMDTFTVGFDAEFPPYGYQDESGEYVGFDLDLAQEVCKRNGWELVKQPIDWDSKDMELSTGAIDCIWNGFTIDGREDAYTWSVPYIDNSQVIVVKEDSGISEALDLAGKTVCVQADSSALAALTGEDATDENKALCASFAELSQVGDYNSAFLNLDTGAVDAVILDYGVANYEVESRSGFIILEEPISSEKYGVGFLKGNTALRDTVQNTLFDMADDGTFGTIAEKWGLTDSVCIERAAAGTEAAPAPEKSGSKYSLSNLGFIASQLLKGLLASCSIFFLTLVFSLPLGLIIAFGRMSRIRPLRWLIKLYISVVRGTPLMLQLLVVFFGPYYIFGIKTPSSYRFIAVIIGFSLNYAAYFAEIYRSGIQAVSPGQHEAAQILGYTKTQTFFRIIFPQMVKNILPAATNEIITLVKDTSLAFAVSYTEMFTAAKQVAASQTTIMPLFVAGLFYYIFNALVALVMSGIEKKIDYFKK